MTLKELREYIDSVPATLDNLEIKIEYPDNGGSSTTKVYSIDWDESDFIISYYNYDDVYSKR